MRRYLLDTTVVSALVRQEATVTGRFRALADDWAISTITRAELQAGLALKPDARELHARVTGFLDHAPTLAWDTTAADAWGRLRAELHTAGRPIGILDEMIAAHALAYGMVVVTHNVRHFRLVPGLVVEDWSAV